MQMIRRKMFILHTECCQTFEKMVVCKQVEAKSEQIFQSQFSW